MYANNDGPAIQGDYNYNEVEDNIAVGQLGYQAKNNDKNSKPVIKKPAQKDSHFDDYDVAKLFNEDFDRSFKIVKSNVEIPKHEENFMNFVNIMENDINVVDDMNEGKTMDQTLQILFESIFYPFYLLKYFLKTTQWRLMWPFIYQCLNLPMRLYSLVIFK